MSVYTDILLTRFVQRGVQGFENDLGRLHTGIGALETRAEKLSLIGSRMTSFGIATAGAIALITGASLKLAGQQQMNEMAFTKLTGSAAAGQAKLKELGQFALETPFDLQQLVKSSQQLVAMGFHTEEIIPTMRSLGNAMSGLGAGQDVFERVVYNLGQIRAQGNATRIDLRQFAMAGINVREVMSRALGRPIDLGEMVKMPESEFIPNFLKGLDAKFGGMMAAAAKTLPGMLSNLRDEAQQTGMAIGNLFIQDGSNLVGWLTRQLHVMRDIAKERPGLAKMAIMLGAGGAAALIAGGQYLRYKQIILTSKAAKQALMGATQRDIAVEGSKALVAGREARAIGATGTAAMGAASAKGALTRSTSASIVAAEAEAKVAQRLSNIQKARYGASKAMSRGAVAVSAARPGALEAQAAHNLSLVGKTAQADIVRAAAQDMNLANLRLAAHPGGDAEAAARVAAAEKNILALRRDNITASKSLSRGMKDYYKTQQAIEASTNRLSKMERGKSILFSRAAITEKELKATPVKKGSNLLLKRQLADKRAQTALENIEKAIVQEQKALQALEERAVQASARIEDARYARAAGVVGRTAAQQELQAARAAVPSRPMTELADEAAKATSRYNTEVQALQKATQAANKAGSVRAGAEQKLAAAEQKLARARQLRANLNTAEKAARAEAEALQGGVQASSKTLLQRVGSFFSREIVAGTRAKTWLNAGGQAAYEAENVARARQALMVATANRTLPASELVGRSIGGARPILRMATAEVQASRLLATGRMTLGSALGAGAAGLFAGLGVNEDLRAQGVNSDTAMYAGIATAVGAAALTAFSPPAAALILAAGLLREGANAIVNRPQEERAEQGDGLTPEAEASTAGMSNRQMAEVYFKEAAQARAEAKKITDTPVGLFDATGGDEVERLNQKAEMLHRYGIRRMAAASIEEREAAEAEMQRRINEPIAQSIARRNAEYAARPNRSGMVDTGAVPTQARWEEGSRTLSSRDMRNGTTQMVVQHTISIPQREADRNTANRDYSSMVPATG